MKRILISLIAIVAIAAACISPFNIFKAMDNYNRLEVAIRQFEQSKGTIDASRSALAAAQSSFDNGRTFEVSYGDIDSLCEVLDNISSVSVSAKTNVDAQENFAPLGEYDANINPSAVKLSLVAEDTVSALNIVNRMELPIYRIFVSEPGLVDVIFLTGGGVA